MENLRAAARFDLLGLLERTVARNAEKVALAKDGSELTYHELGRATRHIAQELVRSGIRPGDRIAILGPSGPRWTRVFFGALESGATVVPLDARLEAQELRGILADAAPRRVFASDELRSRVAAPCGALSSIEEVVPFEWPGRGGETGAPCELPRRRELEDIAVLAYTSGSTGRPKGVMVSFGNLLFQAERLTEAMGTGPEDSFVSILPQNHLLELTGGCLGPLFAGARIDYASPLALQDVVDEMRARAATVLIGVPLFFHALARALGAGAKRGLSPVAALGGRVRMLVSGGAPLDGEVLRFFWENGIPLLEGYGLTETSPVVTLNRLEGHRLGSVGRPLPEVEVRIASTDGGDGSGEILTRGPHVMRGYWNAPELSAEVLDSAGWLSTGDLGRLDEDGYLWITGRAKELIVLGSGKKIQPAEVEAALRAGSELAEVCVVGDHHGAGPLAGTERVCAVIVPAPDLAARHGAAPEALRRAVEELVAALARALAEFKRPRRVLLFPGPLPRTASGKVRRSAIKAWVESQME